MKKEVINPKQLLEKFKKIRNLAEDTIEGKRLLLLSLDSYAEYFIQKLYKNRIEEFKKEENINIDSIKQENRVKVQATHLVIWGVIDKDFLEPIFIIHDLRGELAHDLDPDLSKLENEIDNYVPPMTGSAKKLTPKFFQKTNSWKKLQLEGFATIYHLYESFMDIIREDSDYKLEFHIKPDSSKMAIILKQKDGQVEDKLLLG